MVAPGTVRRRVAGRKVGRTVVAHMADHSLGEDPGMLAEVAEDSNHPGLAGGLPR